MSSQIHLYFHNYEIRNQELIPIKITSSIPDITFPIHRNKLYTLIIYDPDAPKSPFLHWLKVNISDYSNGNSLVPYMAPNPPNHEIHNYIIEIFEQQGPIYTKITQPRPGFPLNEFINHYNLIPIHEISFRTSHS